MKTLFKISFIQSAKGKYFLVLSLPVLFFVGCKVHYDPKIKNSNAHYLVVEGFINANGISNFALSRTRNITSGDTAAYIFETKARVQIEDNSNNVYPLTENSDGNYAASYFLNPASKYRLHIFTSDNKEYASDFVECKQSPPIQILNWELNQGSVWINVNTGDPANNTHYYRWSYSETWEFHSQYFSNLKYYPPDTAVIPRIIPVYVCYQNRNSNNIIIASSAKLQQDVIDKKTIEMIPDHDTRISVLYSILVTQYALDSAGYNYWNAMKTNTENIGSIFGSQPNQTPGNIHNVNDNSEEVIGYIGAGTFQQQRLFISNGSLPSGWNQVPNCTEYEVPNIKDSISSYFAFKGFIPYLKDSTPDGSVKGYFSASGLCVDCTLTGSPVKPSFWP